MRLNMKIKVKKYTVKGVHNTHTDEGKKVYWGSTAFLLN